MATINYLTRVEFDFGAVGRLAEIAEEIGIGSPLIVTDPGIIAAGLLEPVAAMFGDRAVVFSDTPQNPTESAINSAHEAFVAAGCDGIVALGGGSSLDLAKGVRLMTGHKPPLAQYAAVEGGVARIHGKIVPMIAVPTTAGTGSEVGRAAVINMIDGRKLGIISPHMLPTVSVCDPELTLGLPPFLTAVTGMDAISHCLETFMAPAINPPADAIAIDGLGRAVRALPRAVADGKNRQARWDMMMASTEGAMAFQKGLGAVHSLTHPLGAIKELNLHHGTLNAVLTPAVMRFNRPAIGEKWDRIAEIVGDLPDVFFERLNRALGIPSGLDALGLTAAHLDIVSREALNDHCHATTPRRPTEAEYREILEEAR